MYITRDLRKNLQKWRDRFYNAHHTQLNGALDSFLSKIQAQTLINSILVELNTQVDQLDPSPLNVYKGRRDSGTLISLWFESKRFKDDRESAIYHYIFLKFVQLNIERIYLESSFLGLSNVQNEQSHVFVQKYVDPLVNYIYDQLDESSSVLYLLNKYKIRCEWFCKQELRDLYKATDGYHREAVLDEHLRKFLFDQGIDYPFSKTSSPSGEADIVGLLETEDPLVLEVKIFDRNVKYGKDRVVDGFRQIVSYANDYNKPVGYLLIFNMDTAEVDIVTSQKNDKLSVKVNFGGKVYFIIFVNILPHETPTASKREKVEKISILEEELTFELPQS